jgi:hypothetical protein
MIHVNRSSFKVKRGPTYVLRVLQYCTYYSEISLWWLVPTITYFWLKTAVFCMVKRINRTSALSTTAIRTNERLVCAPILKRIHTQADIRSNIGARCSVEKRRPCKSLLHSNHMVCGQELLGRRFSSLHTLSRTTKRYTCIAPILNGIL